MPRTSAGLLVYRRAGGITEVLLVHPGGPWWAKKDVGAWTIPKGELGLDEDPLRAACREFNEETGIELEARSGFVSLTPVKQAGGKVVLAWAVESDLDPRSLRSNTFTMEWPPRSGERQEFSEVDRAEWFALTEARRKILSGQAPFLAELETILAAGKR